MVEGEGVHRSHSTASEHQRGIAWQADNVHESAGTEQAVFGRSGWKQVQMASADSLVVEKQIAEQTE